MSCRTLVEPGKNQRRREGEDRNLLNISKKGFSSRRRTPSPVSPWRICSPVPDNDLHKFVMPTECEYRATTRQSRKRYNRRLFSPIASQSQQSATNIFKNDPSHLQVARDVGEKGIAKPVGMKNHNGLKMRSRSDRNIIRRVGSVTETFPTAEDFHHYNSNTMESSLYHKKCGLKERFQEIFGNDLEIVYDSKSDEQKKEFHTSTVFELKESGVANLKMQLREFITPIVSQMTANVEGWTFDRGIWLVKILARELLSIEHQFYQRIGKEVFDHETANRAQKFVTSYLERKVKAGADELWKHYPGKNEMQNLGRAGGSEACRRKT